MTHHDELTTNRAEPRAEEVRGLAPEETNACRIGHAYEDEDDGVVLRGYN
ncbi:hypothetical protein HQ32_02642 [Prauserella sp. Am3]|nr:hypothetical protein HQ32_02642 [Prauserella sp. Am3]